LHSYIRSRQLYYQLVQYPQEIIPIMDAVAQDEFVNITNHSGPTGKSILFFRCFWALVLSNIFHFVICYLRSNPNLYVWLD
jgi:hypothetical protein